MNITELVEFDSGISQFRISENNATDAYTYTIYGQNDLVNDLNGSSVIPEPPRQIRTFEKLDTLKDQQVIFSLISGKAAIVGTRNIGKLMTRNYVLLFPKKKIDANYLIYLLNESKDIQKQFNRSMQGSVMLKYTVHQLKHLNIMALPSLQNQQLIGSIYLKQLRLQTLKNQVANNETKLRLSELELFTKQA